MTGGGRGRTSVHEHQGTGLRQQEHESEARRWQDAPADQSVPLLTLQRAAGNAAVNALIRTTLSSGGLPLPPHVRADMQGRFGYDFEDVRVHADADAAQSASALHAKAFTVGRDIAFADRRFAPDTFDGRRLLAHELAHVVQQSRGGAPPPLDATAAHEAAAQSAADAVAGGTGPVAVAGATGVGIARAPDENDPEIEKALEPLREVPAAVARKAPRAVKTP